MRFSKKAFTLVEMLIVIVIIGVLAAALIPKITGVQKRARDTARVANMRNIGQAVNIHAIDFNGSYPIAPFYTISANPRALVATIDKYIIPLEPGQRNTSIENLVPLLGEYMVDVPTDPGNGMLVQDSRGECTEKTGDYYAYYSDRDGTRYAITAQMEAGQGNTDNCAGGVNKKSDGPYTTVGEGLIYSEWYLAYDPDEDGDPVERCEERLTQEMVDELNEIQNYGNKNQRCRRTGISWRGLGIGENLPKGLRFLVSIKTLVIQNDGTLKNFYLPSMANLETLSLTNNRSIEKLEFAATMPKLKKIEAANNKITTLEFPDDAPNLETINLRANNISSLKLPVSPPKLRTLSLGSNNLGESLPDVEDDPDANEVGVFTISDATNLQTINLLNNRITKLNLPSEMPKLRVLILKGNRLGHLQLPDELPELIELKAYAAGVRSIDLPSSMPKAQQIHLYSNSFGGSSVVFPDSLPEVRVIMMHSAGVGSITLPSTAPNLTKLWINHNNLGELGASSCQLLASKGRSSPSGPKVNNSDPYRDYNTRGNYAGGSLCP